MDLRENIQESIKSIKSNRLRSILVIVTIAIGLICLIGMLTILEVFEKQELENFAKLGANTFQIESKSNRSRRRQRKAPIPPLKYTEVATFLDKYEFEGTDPSILCWVTGAGVVRRGAKKTNPNIQILGSDEHALSVHSLDLENGRNFTSFEIEGGNNVALLGYGVYKTLFDPAENPTDQYVMIYGTRYKIIGLLQEVGMDEEGIDRIFIVPLKAARSLNLDRQLEYSLAVYMHNMQDMDDAASKAVSLMRKVREDPPGKENSFDMERTDALEASIRRSTDRNKLFAYIIGFITLLGASIGLANVMLVYVKERTQEIGVRKAIGATAFQIRMQFLIEAVYICQIGGLVGIFLGVLIGNAMSMVMSGGDVSLIIPWGPLFLGIVVSTLVGIIAGYVPASNAAKVDPIESLRYE